MIRVGLVSLWHETNTYSSRHTDLAAFEAFELLRGDEILSHRGAGTVIGGMLSTDGIKVVPIFSAAAWPGGRVTRDALNALLASLAGELEAALPLDGLLVNLHGAMVGEGVDDVELEALRRIRAVAGEIPVAAVLDLHGNPSPEFVALCDAAVAYDTYPHVDMRERGREAAALLSAILSGRALRAVVGKVPLLSSPLRQATDQPPMRELQQLARSLSEQEGIARISLLPGFPYSDVARAGFSVIVTAERAVEEAVRRTIAILTEAVERRASEFAARTEKPGVAVQRAIASSRRPVVLVDVADNVGGGAPGDGTTILSELLAQGADRAVVPITDAEVARAAAATRAGGGFAAEVGGKTDNRHGAPVPIHGRVMRVTDGRYAGGGCWMGGREFSMGTTAVVEANGVTLVVMDRAVPPFHPEQLLSVGIDPQEASIIVAKGAVAWRAAYGHVAAAVIEVDTPGICPADPTLLTRTTPPMRT